MGGVGGLELTPEDAAEAELQLMLSAQLRLEEQDGKEDASDARVWNRVFRFRAGYLDVHTKHECPNRPVACGWCGERTIAKLRTHHKEELCPRREVMCGLEGCAKVMPHADLDTHERVKCRFRLVPCANGCRLLVPFIRMGRHTAKDCSERFVPCPLKCGVVLRVGGMDGHIREDCPRRDMASEGAGRKGVKYVD